MGDYPATRSPNTRLRCVSVRHLRIRRNRIRRNRIASIVVKSWRPRREVSRMLLLVLLAILAIIAFGVGFTVHWLFIIAVVVALLWLISLFAGGARGRRRGAWW